MLARLDDSKVKVPRSQVVQVVQLNQCSAGVAWLQTNSGICRHRHLCRQHIPMIETCCTLIELCVAAIGY